MTISLRLAGFEVRDVIEWLYFSGFPKSHNVSKAFDRRAGAEREVVGQRVRLGDRKSYVNNNDKAIFNPGENNAITAPATELARKWDGWGTSLKPAHEPIIMVRKPLHDGRKMTVADCVEKYGTGAINIDASRIEYEEGFDIGAAKRKYTGNNEGNEAVVRNLGVREIKVTTPQALEQCGFPANCITLDGDAFYSKYFNVANISPAELSKKASKKDRNSDWKGEEIDLEESRQQVAFGNRTCTNCGRSKLDGRREGACCDTPSYENKQVIEARTGTDE